MRTNIPKKLNLKKNKYSFNANFFKKWTSKMAYILGFLYADGNIIEANNSSRTNYFQFVSKDKEILEKIKKALNSNHQIKIRNSQKKLFPNKKYYITSEVFYLRIGNKKVVNDLIKLGVLPRKSKIIKFPKIPKKYLNHFIRGYFDGDGTICLSKKKNIIKKVQVIFTSGSKKFLEGLSEILARFLKIKTAKVYNSNRSFQIRYSTKESRKIFKFLYKNAHGMLLKRKFEKFKEIFLKLVKA
jgi:intein/homing endonuclease